MGQFRVGHLEMSSKKLSQMAGDHTYLVCVCHRLDGAGSFCVPQETDHTVPIKRKYRMGVLKGQAQGKSNRTVI